MYPPEYYPPENYPPENYHPEYQLLEDIVSVVQILDRRLIGNLDLHEGKLGKNYGKGYSVICNC